MKNFNFKISNFYSIFSEMPEENKNNINNFDSFLNDGITLSLEDKTSEGFTSEMLKRVALEQEFAREDLKTSKIAKFILAGFTFFILFFIISLASYFAIYEGNEDVGLFHSSIDKFSGLIESTSLLISDNLGFSFDLQTGIALLVLMVFVFIFSASDKILFKKGYK